MSEMSGMKVLRDHLGSSFVVHVLSDGLELAVGLWIISEDVEVLDISGDKKYFSCYMVSALILRGRTGRKAVDLCCSPRVTD